MIREFVRATEQLFPRLEEDQAGFLVGPPPLDPDCPLIGRELWIVQMMAEGKTNANIAAEMALSNATVCGYVLKIFHKMDMHDRAGVVAIAFRKGWLR